MSARYDEPLAADPKLAEQDERVKDLARQIAPVAIVDPARALRELCEAGMEFPEHAAAVAAFAVMRLALAPYPDRDVTS